MRTTGGTTRAGWRRGAGAAALGVLLIGGCEKAEYPQDTPEATLASARAMIERGRADQLSTLIYAENQDMRALLGQMGILLRDIQNLATTIQRKFPEEVEKIKAEASADGLSGLLSQVGQGQRRRRASGDRDRQRSQLDGVVKSVLADPYGWLKDQSGRLSTVPVNDNTVALQWDSKPILPPLGLIMRKDEGKWYVVLPTAVPVVSQFMPRTTEETKTFSAMFRILGNALRDVDRGIKSGELKDMDSVARQAGENAFVPMAMFFIAYGKMMEARQASRPGAEKPAAAETTKSGS